MSTPVTPRDVFCFIDPVDSDEPPGFWYRNHQHTAGVWCPLQLGLVHADGISQDQRLQGRAHEPEVEAARTKAANRAGGNLEDPRLPVPDLQLDVNRAMVKPEGADRGLANANTFILVHITQLAGRDEDGLGKTGPFLRVGLVEYRQH